MTYSQEEREACSSHETLCILPSPWRFLFSGDLRIINSFFSVRLRLAFKSSRDSKESHEFTLTLKLMELLMLLMLLLMSLSMRLLMPSSMLSELLLLLLMLLPLLLILVSLPLTLSLMLSSLTLLLTLF